MPEFQTSIVPLKQIEYGAYVDLLITLGNALHPKPLSASGGLCTQARVEAL